MRSDSVEVDSDIMIDSQSRVSFKVYYLYVPGLGAPRCTTGAPDMCRSVLTPKLGHFTTRLSLIYKASDPWIWLPLCMAYRFPTTLRYRYSDEG